MRSDSVVSARLAYGWAPIVLSREGAEPNYFKKEGKRPAHGCSVVSGERSFFLGMNGTNE